MLFAVPLWAGPVKLDSLTVGSETYSNVTLLGANATDVYFTHGQGIANAKLRQLPAALQKMFHYDPATAAAAERRQLEDDARYQTNLAATLATRAAQIERERSTQLASPPEPLADPVSSKSFLGKPAPTMEVDQWLGEKPSLQGKYVVVSFWTVGSPACRKVIPALNALQKQFADKLVVVGLTTNAPAEIEEMPGPKPVFTSGIDSRTRFAAALDVTSVPCVVLIDPAGIIRYQGHPAAITENRISDLMARMSK